MAVAKQKHKYKITPDFSEGVDRKLLKQIRDRFLYVNTERLSKTREGLSFRQQDMLQVLPLLYQVNHPLLPGYVSRSAPSGVSGYEPDKTILRIAKTFSQTFKYRRDKRTKSRIHALFIMGSTGTLAHSEASDVDVWLCHAPDLQGDALRLLTEKAKKIDQWANDAGLELHTFLMNAETFKSGGTTPDMDAESSGSAQHYLLLDEFYRTAILLAGRYPLWWLIPPDMEANYEQISTDLLGKRFIKESEIIDFGSAANIPKSELIGAGLWQLYKGLDSPYKSVLKLLLAEVYAQELPKQSSLSQTFKHAVYDDELSVEDLDPYLLIYRRLEDYLLSLNEHKRLDLVRKSFYLKVAKKLSKRPTERVASWQRKALEKAVRNWGWPDSKFKYLDERSGWKVEQVVLERQEVVAELTYCYRFLANYARAHNIESTITAQDLNLLGRKLYATFQRKAGKVECVNPGIAANLWEENLAIHHSSSQPFASEKNCWLLYRDLTTATDAAFHTALKKTSNLLELITWLYVNGIINHQTRLSVVAGESLVSLAVIQSMIRALEAHIPLPLQSVSQAQFQQRATIKKLVLFINVGIDPMAAMTAKGLHRLSDRTDSLDYSSERSNLVKTIDQVALNSWNEVTAHRYEMGETLMQNLQSWLQICLEQLSVDAHQDSECELSVHCYCPQRAHAIAGRVKDLFHDARQAFFINGKARSARFVIEIEDKLYILQHIDGQFRYIAFDTEQDAFDYLSQGLRDFSPIILDTHAQESAGSLRLALARSKAGCIQVFYQMAGDKINIILLDEHGSLLRFSLPNTNEEVFQSSISRFMQSVIEKRQLSESLQGGGELLQEQVILLSFKLYKITTDKKSSCQLKEITRIPQLAFHEVHIRTVYEGMQLHFDASVKHAEFSHLEYGEQQIEALVHYVNNHADMDDRLPIKVGDITLSENLALSNTMSGLMPNTLEYFRLYQQLESRLSTLRT